MQHQQQLLKVKKQHYVGNQKYPQWFYNKIDAEGLIITLTHDNVLGKHENLYLPTTFPLLFLLYYV